MKRASKFRQRLQELEAKRNVQWALEGCDRQKEKRVKRTIVRIQAIVRGFLVRQSDIGVKVAAKCPKFFSGSIWALEREDEEDEKDPKKLAFQPQKKFPKKPEKGSVPLKPKKKGLGEQTQYRAQVFSNLADDEDEPSVKKDKDLSTSKPRKLKKENAVVDINNQRTNPLAETKERARQGRTGRRSSRVEETESNTKFQSHTSQSLDESSSALTVQRGGEKTRHKHRHRVRKHRKDETGKRITFHLDPAEEHKREERARLASRLQAREAWSRSGSRAGSRAGSRREMRGVTPAMQNPFENGDFAVVSMYENDDTAKSGSMTQRHAWGEDTRPNSAEMAAIRRNNRLSMIRFPTKTEIKSTVAIQRWWRKWWWAYFGKKRRNNRLSRILAAAHAGRVVKRAFYEMVIQKKIARVCKTLKYQRVMKKAKARFYAVRIGQAVRSIDKSNQAESYKRKVADVSNLIVKYTDPNAASQERNHLLFSLAEKSLTLKTEYVDLLTTAELKVTAMSTLEPKGGSGSKLKPNKSRSMIMEKSSSKLVNGTMTSTAGSTAGGLGGRSRTKSYMGDPADDHSSSVVQDRQARRSTQDKPWRRLTETNSASSPTKRHERTTLKSSTKGTPVKSTPKRRVSKPEPKSEPPPVPRRASRGPRVKPWEQSATTEVSDEARKRAEARNKLRQERQEKLDRLAAEKAKRAAQERKRNERLKVEIQEARTPKDKPSPKKARSAPVRRQLPVISSPTKKDWSRVQSKIRQALDAAPVKIERKRKQVKVVTHHKVDYSNVTSRIDFGMSEKEYKKVKKDHVETAVTRPVRKKATVSDTKGKGKGKGKGKSRRVRQKPVENPEDDPDVGTFLTAVRGGGRQLMPLSAQKQKSKALLSTLSRKRLKKINKELGIEDEGDEEDAPEPAPKPAMTYSLSFDFSANNRQKPAASPLGTENSQLSLHHTTNTSVTDMSDAHLSGSELSDSGSVASASDVE